MERMDLIGMQIVVGRDQEAYNYIKYFAFWGQLGRSMPYLQVEDQNIEEDLDSGKFKLFGKMGIALLSTRE